MIAEAEEGNAWERFTAKLKARGLPVPGSMLAKKPATMADKAQIYAVLPSFVDLLPWVEYLTKHQCLLLDDGVSLAAFFELTPVCSEGREIEWLCRARDSIEHALQDSFEEFDNHPWVVQFYVQDELNLDEAFKALSRYIQPRAQNSAFTNDYLLRFARHLKAISRPGGFFEDKAVSKLPWRGQSRRTRAVVYRRVGRELPNSRTLPPAEALENVCARLCASLASADVRAQRLKAADIHDWLLAWFNPNPTHLGEDAEALARFRSLARYPPETSEGEIELASGRDFSERLFYRQPVSDTQNGVWLFDAMPHRVIVCDRLRAPPGCGQITGEAKRGADAINALFDQMPEGTVMCLTLIVTPQDTLEAHLNQLAKKAVGDTLDSQQARQDVSEARGLIGSAHKLYRGSVAFYIKGADHVELKARGLQLANAMLSAGLQPVHEEDEVAPLNTYLRWLPCVYDPGADKRQWYTQLMFAQHMANLAPVWGRSSGTGHPGISFFNRGGGTVTFDPLNRLDRQMNAHLFIFGPTGSGKSAGLIAILMQLVAVYRPRLFVIEAGNSFGLFGDFAANLGLTVHKVKLAPGSGISLAPFADALRLIGNPQAQAMLDAHEEDLADDSDDHDDQRDILGELEIIARLMITGGEVKEEARLTRADRGAIRQCIMDGAQSAANERRGVLTHDVRDALKNAARDETLPETRRNRLLEMSEAMTIFCQGADGGMFDRPGTPWPEADITIVDLATFAREGYSAQLSIAYVSLINTINNIAEREQFSGRPIVVPTDEGHVIFKIPLLPPYVVKITKMWRKLNAWFWLGTQNVDDIPKEAESLLNMIEWWICLSMPPDEVEKIARFRALNPAQKALMLSARKESGKFSEGVILSKSMEALFRAVPPSLALALAMTEPEEKAERARIMREHGCTELEAACRMAQAIDRARGIEPAP
jgi:conjugative transfer ATPase